MAKTVVFEEPDGDLPEHYAAIGRLITSFSTIEHALNQVLRTLLGLSEEVGRAVIGEMRAGDLMAALTRVLEARARDEIIAQSEKGARISPEALRKAIANREAEHATNPIRVAMRQLFDEIRRLKIIRDDIAHRRFYVGGREMVFTNADTARSLLTTQYNSYSIEDLNDLTIYAKRLAARSHLLLNPAAVNDVIARGVPLLEIPVQLRKADNHQAEGTVRRERRRQRRSSPA
jgi:hypothetical protein